MPADPTDPFLTRWLKPAAANPLGLPLPPGGVRAQFRDPVSPWRVPADRIGPDLAAWLGWPPATAADKAAAAAEQAAAAAEGKAAGGSGVGGSGGNATAGGGGRRRRGRRRLQQQGGGSSSSNSRNGSSSGDDGGGGGGVWFTAVGALDDCVGSAALYSSPDLRAWTYAGACV